MSQISYSATEHIGMNQSPCIRLATEDDTQEVSKLVTAVLKQFDITPDIEGLDKDLFNVGQAQKTNYLELVLEAQGAIAGVAVLHLTDQEHAHLSGIYLLDTVRGQGLGKKLLSEVLDQAAQKGIRWFTLNTRDRFAAAVKLYESTGWVRGEDVVDENGPNLTYHFDYSAKLHPVLQS